MYSSPVPARLMILSSRSSSTHSCSHTRTPARSWAQALSDRKGLKDLNPDSGPQAKLSRSVGEGEGCTPESTSSLHANHQEASTGQAAQDDLFTCRVQSLFMTNKALEQCNPASPLACTVRFFFENMYG